MIEGLMTSYSKLGSDVLDISEISDNLYYALSVSSLSSSTVKQ